MTYYIMIKMLKLILMQIFGPYKKCKLIFYEICYRSIQIIFKNNFLYVSILAKIIGDRGFHYMGEEGSKKAIFAI